MLTMTTGFVSPRPRSDSTYLNRQRKETTLSSKQPKILRDVHRHLPPHLRKLTGLKDTRKCE